MDAIDREILSELRANARISFRDLGARVGLSANAAADRLRRLERSGVISGYAAIIDPAAANRHLVALIEVLLVPGTPSEEFEDHIARMDVVVDAMHVTGRFDYQLRVAVADAQELDDTIRALKRDANVVETDTRLCLRTVMRRMPAV